MIAVILIAVASVTIGVIKNNEKLVELRDHDGILDILDEFR